jgi:demethylmenaquinone methyltransferase/2-methoxy-6-polyprenyl-1,4-benzoquinol methylase
MESQQVKKMFETIAFSYDFQNSFLSLGIDTVWRKILARHVLAGKGALVLDAATGTGELCLNICRHRPGIHIVGLDIASRMLSLAIKKIEASPFKNCISLALGDGRYLPLQRESVDVVTMAFGIRNIKERHQVLREFSRVLKTGGQLLVMEFGFPKHPFVRRLYRFYFDHVLPPLGNWLSRTDYAYSYLVQSVYEFPGEGEFCSEIESAGFRIRKVTQLTFGIAKIYEAAKRIDE